MEKITIPLEEYKEMIRQINLLKQLEDVDMNLVRQFRDSLEDVKKGRIFQIA
jgi:hypothetical protein